MYKSLNSLNQVKPRGLFVLPYVSIVIEKTAHLNQVLKPSELSVRGYYGKDQISAFRPQVWNADVMQLPEDGYKSF